MQLNKIVRSVCYFADTLNDKSLNKLNSIADQLQANGFELQTRRICFTGMSIEQVDAQIDDDSLFISVGMLNREQAHNQLDDFVRGGNISFNLTITEDVTLEDVRLLFEIIRQNASKTFNFTYSVNNPPSSPFFPSASYARGGFSIGLQCTDLGAGCEALQDWFHNMKQVWHELIELFGDDPEFIGIDSSIAPLFDGESSFVNLIERIHAPFTQAVTTDVFTQISNFIKTENPMPIGLCGLMFPCLEDASLARYYDEGQFSVERNLFLSLHSGLGIDTYPIGIDEQPERVLEILQLMRALSNRYKKPLSARFISDGIAKIGEQTDLQNQYLQDVTVRPL